MATNSTIATVHALITVGLGLWWAATTGSRQQVAYVACYIVGAEILWRMNEARVFWEYGKYAVVLILGVVLLRTRATRIPLLAFAYFLLLLPAVLPTLFDEPFSSARQTLSFNLSGHLALFVSVWFFSHLRLSLKQLRWLLLVLILPIVGAAAITLNILMLVPEVRFTTESNFVTSGGFGPNQVSMVFGLGVVAIWYLLLFLRPGKVLTVIGLALGSWFVYQGLLTFSRGGILVAAAVMLIIALQGVVRRRQLAQRGITVLIAVLLALIFLPQIDAFTGGTLSERYQESNVSGRDTVVQTDLLLFEQNPIQGAGVGAATRERGSLIGSTTAAHTEFTRLLAEHGMLGVLALAVLTMMGIQQLIKSWNNPSARAIVLGFTLWALLSMTHSAMRIAAIPMMFGLAFAQFDIVREESSDVGD
jgi:O-antigen ligase